MTFHCYQGGSDISEHIPAFVLVDKQILSPDKAVSEEIIEVKVHLHSKCESTAQIAYSNLSLYEILLNLKKTTGSATEKWELALFR